MNNSYKKIFYRATHRGTKELDLRMIEFMDKVFHLLRQEQKDEFSLIVDTDDYQLTNWLEIFERENKFVDNM